MKGSGKGHAVLLALGLLQCSMTRAAEDSNATLAAALADTRPLVDIRLRYENVEQEPLTDEAGALLLRGRLGFETGSTRGIRLLAEGDFLWPLRTAYRPDPTVATRLTYPVVADAEAYELNRLQLTNTSLPGTTITLGRQRINLDDQRFVGNVGWRMNEQTYDALRVVNKSVAGLTVDLTYVNRINRVFGADSPQGRYKGDSLLGNLAYQFKPGKLTAFGYLVDIEPIAAVAAAVRDSNATYGLRFAGQQRVGGSQVTYAAAYARQRDYADNPLSFELAYYLAEAGATVGRFNLGASYEVLEGDGTKGFTTPLATLHRFQGWADKFLATPADGIRDLQLTLGWSGKSIGPFETLSLAAGWHDYSAERTSQSYGSELNLQVQAKRGRFTGLAKFADYAADGLLTDTKKLWLQLEFVW